MSSLPHQYQITTLIAVLLPMGEWQVNRGRSFALSNKQHAHFPVLPSNINGDVLATFRVVFRVSRVQQYSDSFVQDLLRAGLSSAMHGKPLEVPEYGGINSIILLGSKTILYQLSTCGCVVGVRRWSEMCDVLSDSFASQGCFSVS